MIFQIIWLFIFINFYTSSNNGWFMCMYMWKQKYSQRFIWVLNQIWAEETGANKKWEATGATGEEVSLP